MKELLRKKNGRVNMHAPGADQFKPQVSFNYLGQFDTDINRKAFRVADEYSGAQVNPGMERNHELDFTGMIADQTLAITVAYNPNRIPTDKIKHFMTELKNEVEFIVEFCVNTEMQLTPSDLSYKDMSIDELDAIKQLFN
jgi:iturin family lipopeptide synthetase B